VWSWDSREPFGASPPTVSAIDGPFSFGLRFPGQYQDVETGLVSNGFRDYDPDLGRYLEPDPTGLAAGMNMYVYVNSNPISDIDPLGLMDYGAHHYSTWTPLCAGNCTPQQAFDAVRHFAAPCEFYAAAGTHQVTLCLGNKIVQTVDTCKMTITNVALPGHVFGGQVVISITNNNGVIGEQVEGGGVGPNATINKLVGPPIFGALGILTHSALNPGEQGGSL
jgi:RHS repeat-associated protein